MHGQFEFANSEYDTILKYKRYFISNPKNI